MKITENFMKKIIFIILLCLTTVNAQTDILTLEKSIELGLSNSKEIKISMSDTLISDALLTNAWSNLLPQVSLGFTYNHISEMPIQLKIPFLPASSGEVLNAMYSNATIEQPLFAGFKLLALKNAAFYNNKATISENWKVKNNKALEINTAFWNYFKAINLVDILSGNLDVVRLQVDNVANFNKNEMSSENDLLKIKVKEAELKLKIIEAQNQMNLAHANFNRVIGLNIGNNTKIIPEDLDEKIIEFDFNSLLNEALNTNMDLTTNNYRKMVADEKITIANSSYFPQISAFGSYYYLKLSGSSMLNDDLNNFWMIGINAKWNIWDWWKTSSNSDVAVQEHNKIEIAIELLKEKVQLEVYSNMLNLQSFAQKIELNKLMVESASENFRITNNKFESQIVTTTELIEASALLTEAKIKLVNSQIDYKLGLLQLYNSIGRIIY
jgi:outer membrane protein TolC